MPPEEQTSLADAVADQLASHPAGMSVTDLGRRLHTANLAELTRILLRLQDRRLARPTGGRWRWIGPPRVARPAPGGPAARRPTLSPAQKPASGPGTQPELPGTGPGPRVTASRWDEFRRLCRYYAEYIRLEERASVRVYAEKENQDFIQIAGAVDWATLESGQPITLRLSPESAVFVRRGLSGNKLPFWFLGLPVDVFHGTDVETGTRWTKLEPILVAAVQPTNAGDDSVTLEPLAPLEVNPGWLARRFKRGDQRAEFLATVGLDESASGALDESEEVRLRLASFRIAVDALRVAYRDWWREFPSLDDLRTDPPLEQVRENGLYNRAILVSQPRLKYSARLHGELLQLADPERVRDEDLDRTALRTLFSPEPAIAGKRAAPTPPNRSLPEYALLNEEQRHAVRCAMHHDLTVMTGPPGTGKSLTVRHVMAGMALEKRSVLFASRNHQAIEAVEPELNALVEPECLVLRPSRPWGQEARSVDWQQALIQLLTRPRNSDATANLESSRHALQTALDDRQRIEDSLRRLLELSDGLAGCETALREATDAVPVDLREFVGPGSAFPRLEALESLLRDIRAMDRGGSTRLGRLVHSLRNFTLRLCGRDPERSVRARLSAIDRDIRNATGDRLTLTLDSDEHPSTALESIERAMLVAAACAAQRALQGVLTSIEGFQDRSTLQQQLEEAMERLHEQTRTVLRQVAEVSGAELDPQTRQHFAELQAGLLNHRGSPSLERFERAFAAALPDLLRHFPLWATSNLSVHKAIPMAPGTVELLIVDEASQCDIPSVVPMLYRAKRAMIVGDPMQLGHISTMSRPAELRVRQLHDLVGPQHLERFSVGVNSLYHLAANSTRCGAIVQLRAHYRCHPQIAAYCNRAFYGGTLRVMTNEGRLRRVPGIGSARACAWTDVRGDVQSAASGCHSPSEVDAVVAIVRRLVADGFEGSVGVVTPFRVQANRIQDAVAAAVPADTLGRMKFLSHTVDGFQGDERDVILFSLVAGPGMPAGSRGFLQAAPNRFNVAISRARSFVRVIGNREWASSCGIGHIQELVAICESSETGYSPRPDLIGPVWEPRLAEALRAAGLPFHQQYPTCGFYLDFAMVSEDFRLDIEVDGETWHRGADGKRIVDDLYRDHVLQSAGWHVLRFWVYQIKDDINDCIRTIQDTWSRGTRR